MPISIEELFRHEVLEQQLIMWDTTRIWTSARGLRVDEITHLIIFHKEVCACVVHPAHRLGRRRFLEHKMLNQLVILDPSNELTDNLWLKNKLFTHSPRLPLSINDILQPVCSHYVFKQANGNAIKQLVTRGFGVYSRTCTRMRSIHTRAAHKGPFSLSKVVSALQSNKLIAKKHNIPCTNLNIIFHISGEVRGETIYNIKLSNM